MLISNLSIVTPAFQTVRGSLQIEGERIGAVGNAQSAAIPDSRDMEGLLCLPGLIDIHTHGGGGVDACDKDEEKLQRLTSYYARHGVTSFCPTTMTLPPGELEDVFRAIEQVKGNETGAYIHGVNMEGPFVSKEKCGAQNPAYIRAADVEEVKRLQAISHICLLDLAPEAEGAPELARRLSGSIVCSVAHTNASFEQTEAAFAAGFSHVTHLFNAMTPFSHRSPGAVGAVFQNDRVTAELICDGFHLAPATVRLAFKLLGANRCVAVSDSLSCADCPDGDYALGGQAVVVKQGRAFLQDGTIAGSTADLFEAFKNLLKFGIPFADALMACTINPARVIGADRDCGSIEQGKYADLIFLDSAMRLRHVMVKGRWIF